MTEVPWSAGSWLASAIPFKAAGRSLMFCWTCLRTASSCCIVSMVVGSFSLGSTSVCCTAKHPPKLFSLRQRTVHTLPAEANQDIVVRTRLIRRDRGRNNTRKEQESQDIHPVHAMLPGNVTFREIMPFLFAEDSWTLSCVWPVAPFEFPVWSMSHVNGPAPSRLTC